MKRTFLLENLCGFLVNGIAWGILAALTTLCLLHFFFGHDFVGGLGVGFVIICLGFPIIGFTVGFVIDCNVLDESLRIRTKWRLWTYSFIAFLLLWFFAAFTL